ncbi:choice-of-anchor Q domain-containing protein [Candidatus Villigracilis affinis]|uniref:choice-of-anchor Q domain-containing protein n=1 Tax=Candidatus Villigracilis affinis TaxID=3140682 RepID=UPI001E052B58|nr:hypothetical protein [Anaerolineales bacterium]
MNPILGANNLTNDSSCGDSFIISSTIRLGTLGDYGGYTQTIPLLSGSSAIDAGNDATCTTTDQRGTTRPQGAACDIGAFEYVESVSPPPPAVFADVPLTHWANEWVEKLYAGIRVRTRHLLVPKPRSPAHKWQFSSCVGFMEVHIPLSNESCSAPSPMPGLNNCK